MKKLYLLFVFIISCTPLPDTDVYKASNVELTYQNLKGNFVSEDLTNKSTLIIFWADY